MTVDRLASLTRQEERKRRQSSHIKRNKEKQNQRTAYYRLGKENATENGVSHIADDKPINDRVIGLYMSILNSKCQDMKKNIVIGSSFILPATEKSMKSVDKGRELNSAASLASQPATGNSLRYCY